MFDGDSRPLQASDPQWVSLRAAMARAVRRQCPAWLYDDADDIAQAAIMKVVVSHQGGEGKPLPSSFYLHKVAHSALVDEIRRRKRRREVALEDGPSTGDDAPGASEPVAAGTPEATARLRELGAAVRACLQAMARDRRLALVLYLQQHTVPEAARLLGWAAKRTENLVYRGLADLRQCLLARGHTP